MIHSFKTFERCGLACSRELHDAAGINILRTLECANRDFQREAHGFRSPAYKWPTDFLNDWSRPWEYSYVYYHLQHWLKRRTETTHCLVVDLGSGVTFFPFACARLGLEIVCTDVDEVCAQDVPRAAMVVKADPGTVQYRHIIDRRLPFDDNTVDALYCISVLEHIPDKRSVILEMARVLKPKGLILLTLDIDRLGMAEMPLGEYASLSMELSQVFDLAYPLRPIPKRDRITTQGAGLKGCLNKGLMIFKQFVIKPIIGRKPTPINLCVMGLVMKMKACSKPHSIAGYDTTRWRTKDLLVRMERQFPVIPPDP